MTGAESSAKSSEGLSGYGTVVIFDLTDPLKGACHDQARNYAGWS